METRKRSCPDLPTDSSEESSEEYFEESTEELENTIANHVLDRLSKRQRRALSKQIKSGVRNGLDLCKKLAVERFATLVTRKPTNNLWKIGMGPSDIKKYSKQLKQLRKTEKSRKVTMKRILKANVSQKEKLKLIKLFDMLQLVDEYSDEYQNIQWDINNKLEAAVDFGNVEEELKNILQVEKSLKNRILTAEMDAPRKAAIYEKYLLLEKSRDDSTTAANLEEWIEEALKTPYTKVNNDIFSSKSPGEELVKLKRAFNTHLSELDVVLQPLLSIFNNRMNNPDAGSVVIGLKGAPGVGKSSICQVIAKVWGLPFKQISLGGVIDSSILDGQHQGWVGSKPGRFAKALQDMGVINGVLFLDEIDKLGETPSGLQVQYSLLHSTDPVQNKHFTDHYLGSKLPLDLSKCIIICALNRTDNLDPALLNRMCIINVPDYTTKQKTLIMRKHLFPQALSNAGLTTDDITLPEETCKFIVSRVEAANGKEGGVRGVKTCLRIIVDKLSLLIHTTPEQQRELNMNYKINTTTPIAISESIVTQLYKVSKHDGHWNRMYI